MAVTVADVIAHLQTLPPDLEVWWYWDEGGIYGACKVPPGRIERISPRPRGPGPVPYREYEADIDADYQRVCVMQEPLWTP